MPESEATSAEARDGRLGDRRFEDRCLGDRRPGDRRLGRRTLLFVAGAVCTAVGLVGIVLPLLPTTPFLLLAAFCFARSSDRAHRWLTTNAVFGRYLKRYVEGQGLSRPTKAFILVLIWGAALASGFLVIDWLVVRVILFLIVFAVSIHIVRLRPRSGGNTERPGAPPLPFQQEVTATDDLGTG